MHLVNNQLNEESNLIEFIERNCLVELSTY